MKTFDIAIKYLKDIDFSFWDITKKPDEQPEMQEILMNCYERYMADKDNCYSNENYRAGVFECATFHLIDAAHGRLSCFMVACQICRNNEIIFTYKNYETRGAYPKVMWDEWDKYCRSTSALIDKNAATPEWPFYLSGESASDIFMCAYHYTFDRETPRWIMKLLKSIITFINMPFVMVSAIVIPTMWAAAKLFSGELAAMALMQKIINAPIRSKNLLQTYASIVLWLIIILAIVNLFW